MSTDAARLPPLPPFAAPPDVTATPAVTLPQQELNAILATVVQDPSERAGDPLTTKKAPFLSPRANDLLIALTVLLAGFSILMWADAFDPTDSQWFVTIAATGSAFTSAVLFATLRSVRRHQPGPMPTV